MIGEIKSLAMNRIHKMIKRIIAQIFSKYPRQDICKRKFMNPQKTIQKCFTIVFQWYYMKKIIFKHCCRLQWGKLSRCFRNMIS